MNIRKETKWRLTTNVSNKYTTYEPQNSEYICAINAREFIVAQPSSLRTRLGPVMPDANK
jgi:hypothetical protein